MLVKLAIDFEFPAPLWWKSGGRARWDESIARSWLAEAARIRGWTGGPDCAASPVLSKPIDEDQDI